MDTEGERKSCRVRGEERDEQKQDKDVEKNEGKGENTSLPMIGAREG